MGDVALYGGDDVRPPAPQMTGSRVGPQKPAERTSWHQPGASAGVALG
jgi:hypothetical protein